MKKRTMTFLTLLILCMGFSVYRIFWLSTKESLQTVAARNGTYNLKVCSNRGNIYDCNNKPLVENQKTNMLVVIPDASTPSLLSEVLTADQMPDALEKLKLNKPFCIDVGDKSVSANGLKTFKITKRLNNCRLAPHILGYLDSGENGVCGIEKSFNDYLNNSRGTLNVRYRMDALGRLLSDKDVIIEDNTNKQAAGVVLNLDKRLQEISELVAEKYLKKGAILITEVPNCEIRACVSIPTFSKTNMEQCLKDESAPLINRAFMPYNLGSVFKLVTAAQALELNPALPPYTCTGEIKVDDAVFHCFNNTEHNAIDIADALAYSCNTYFVELAKNFDPQSFWRFIDKLGFGKPIELAPNLSSSMGKLPSMNSLSQMKYMANLSFGQGSLMVTPLQVSALINAVTSDGFYSEPKLVKGLVNEKMEYIKTFETYRPEKVFSKSTAQILKEGMHGAIDKGTGKKARPYKCTAAVKTGTAQTGIKKGNRMVLQGWCAGFFPFESPKYSVVVLAEDAEGGGQSCGPVFKKIIDEIYNLFWESGS